MKELARTACLLSLLTGPASAGDVVAFDMVGSTDQNLISHTNIWDGAFGSAGDGFQKYQRGVSATIPFSVLDDTLVTFPADVQGIVDDNNLDVFFGVTDTVNPDTTGPVSATWVFDITGYNNLTLSLNMGAMGDFEASDSFSFDYSVDGGVSSNAFSTTVDEAASLDYTLASGTVVTLDDPMSVNGNLLNNLLTTYTVPLVGYGNELTVTLTAETNGGTEAFAFQDMVIEGVVTECFLVLGSGPGVTAFTPAHHTFWPQVSEVISWYPVLMNDIPEFVLPAPGVVNPMAGYTLINNYDSPYAAQTYTVQVLMWNPQVFPQQPEQWTGGLQVYVLPSGRVISRPYGDALNMGVSVETYRNDLGQAVLRFPFTIDGF